MSGLIHIQTTGLSANKHKIAAVAIYNTETDEIRRGHVASVVNGEVDDSARTHWSDDLQLTPPIPETGSVTAWVLQQCLEMGLRKPDHPAHLLCISKQFTQKFFQADSEDSRDLDLKDLNDVLKTKGLAVKDLIVEGGRKPAEYTRTLWKAVTAALE